MAGDIPMREPVYRRSRSLASGIPLGGLGTGSVELRDDGRFHDWEIFNNYSWSGDARQAPPDMWSEDAFFAVRVRKGDGPPVVRLLYQDDMKSRSVAPQYEHAVMYNFPFLRQVARLTYWGRFPFARIAYEDDALPVELSLEAFSPFIPFNSKDSALPLAFFVFRVANRSASACDVSLMFSMRNCVGYDVDQLTLIHQVVREEAGTFIEMGAEGVEPSRRTFGSMAIGALGDGVSFMPAWTDGRGLQGFPVVTAPAMCQLFYPFRDCGELGGSEGEWRRAIARRAMEVPPGVLHSPKVQFGWRWRGALCRKLTLQPGQEAGVVFLFSWFFPNHYHYLFADQNLGHMYANWFGSAGQVARYGAGEFGRLRRQSRAFCDALYEGCLEPWLAASLNAQLTTFPQSFWWTGDGDVAVWEGSACCQLIPAARTPWSSWQLLMFFPDLYLGMVKRMAAFSAGEASGAARSTFLQLERQRREAMSRARRDEFGGWYERRFKQCGYRAEDFVPPHRPRRRPGLAGEACAVQLLRDYMWTGDRDYLNLLWPAIKDALESEIEADANGDGLPDGAISFITYDHWFLPPVNCYKCSMWLAELRAGARLAALLGDAEAAERFAAALIKGAESFERLLWNGEYYNLCFDMLQKRADRGCMADQVSGHLYLRLCGLEPVHDQQRVRSALRSVYRHNRRPEEGLPNGADPEGRTDWRYFARFSGLGEDEALAGQWVTPWTGTEYYVSAVMIAEGLVQEGLDVARDVFDRYVAAGMLYNHIECGEHYFRPMAAWAILPALQGLVYDASAGCLRFAPRLRPETFDSVFVLPGAWGRLRQMRTANSQTDEVSVESGTLRLSCLCLELPCDASGRLASVQAFLGGQEVACQLAADGASLRLGLPGALALGAGDKLTVQVLWRQ